MSKPFLLLLALSWVSSVTPWINHQLLYSPPRIHQSTSLRESPVDTDAVNNNEEAKHLIAAGQYFKGIDEDVGNALCRAGVAWSLEWSQVAEELERASNAFWDVLSKKNISPKLQTICRSVAQELEDISTIEGCSSVGPAASVPNWITIHQYLEDAAAAYEGDEEDQHIYDILKKTSLEIEALIESI